MEGTESRMTGSSRNIFKQVPSCEGWRSDTDKLSTNSFQCWRCS